MSPPASFDSAYVIPIAFLSLMAYAMFPSILEEPYGRVYVGEKLDVGSHLFSLLFPTALWALFAILGIVAAIVITFQGLRKIEAFNDVIKRFWPLDTPVAPAHHEKQ